MPIEGLEWLDPMMVFGMLLCLLIAYIAYKARSPAVMLVSSFGWVILAFQIYQATDDPFIMGLMIMVAFAQFFLPKRGD